MVFQPSLLDAGQPVVPGPTAGHPERRQLGAGAWIEHCSSWVGGADALFAHLVAEVPWQAEQRWMYERMVDVPRLVHFYEPPVSLPHPALEAARRVLSEQYGAEAGGPFSTVGLCLYRDGTDSVAWHGDTIGRGAQEDVVVAIVSLGERRRLRLRPRRGGSGLAFELGRGDLLVMGGSFQRIWEHAVPKTRRPVGPRISVQFRPLDVR